jgi:succinate dehydrogenase / fumarate reductase, iron-sulfur subunit
MDLTLNVWRQAGPRAAGRMERYEAKGVSPDMSFLEMLDMVNERLLHEGKDPIAFEHDCREGICGSCSMMVDGAAHGRNRARGTTVCQLHMRNFKDGDVVSVEPWRANAFPVIKDLVVDRSAFDRVMQAGGFVSTNAGSAPDANAVPIPKAAAEEAMDAAACIGCGACVAACPNASAMLFVAAKIAHLGRLPQGVPEGDRRVVAMVEKMDEEGFGNCTNHYECMDACPKDISVKFIAEMNRKYLAAGARRPEERKDVGAG